MAVCIVPTLLSCGSGIVKKVDVSRPARVMLMDATGPTARPANTFGAAGLALAVRTDNDRRFILAVAEAAAEEVRTPPNSEVVVSARSGGVDWQCVAEAETGSDWSMHGATYSTAYGMVNDIIYEYASPEVQQRVFSGTATEAEQTDIAARFAADHGTGGWGTLTRQKCGL